MRWFEVYNGEIRGEDNNSRIRRAVRLIGNSADTMNPMREAIFGAPDDESNNPDRKKIDEARKQKLDEVMEECEDDFRRISAMTAKVWANVTVATKAATSPAKHIKMLQEAVKQEAATADMRTRFLEYGQQDNSATMTYLELLSLLVYTTRVMVRYFTYMLRMWVEHTNYMSSPTDMDKDLKRQIERAVMALSNAQEIWYQLIRAPRTLAWALHLLEGDWVINRTPDKSTGQDKAARYSLPDDDSAADEDGGLDDEYEAAQTLDVPGSLEKIIHDVDTIPMQQMIRSFFRLGSVTYQQRQAEKDITPNFIQGSQNLFDIRFIPNMDERHYGPGGLRKLVKSYWEKLDAQVSTEMQRIASRLLVELSSSQYFQDGNKELKLFTTSTARAHCESIIMVDWYEKHGRNKGLPPIGISRAACGTCTILLHEILRKVYMGRAPPAEGIVTGVRDDAFCTCMLPARTPTDVKLRVLESLEEKIEGYLRKFGVIQGIQRHVAKSKGKPVEEREASSPESSPASYSDIESQGRDDSDSF